jgi:4-amino-4-deoxy-L-arabinose transferase-like glycosyltransferase
MRKELKIAAACFMTYIPALTIVDIFNFTDPSLVMLIGWIACCFYFGILFLWSLVPEAK